MPQLIALAIAGTVAYAGYKWLAKHNERAAAQKARARAAQQARKSGDPRDLGELRWDEAAGVYRPHRD